jgi:hypothetical protein
MLSQAFMIDDGGGSDYESPGSLYDRSDFLDERWQGRHDHGISSEGVVRAFSDFPKYEADTRHRYVDDTLSAVLHYYLGEGEPVELGSESKQALREHPRVKQAYESLRTGRTKSSGEFGIDMQSYVFHIGDTVIKYDTTCDGSTCDTVFTGFYKDGFWDPSRLLSDTFYSTPSDGSGPDSELGGTPYNYLPYHWEITFSQPSTWQDIKYPNWMFDTFIEKYVLPLEPNEKGAFKRQKLQRR